MEAKGHYKAYYLDYSTGRELCCTGLPGQARVLAQKPVGTGLSALLNIGTARLEKLRTQLQKLLPMSSRDPDAYAVMLSIKLGNTPLPDSEFAAALFSLIEQIAELDDLFYVSMQADRLFNQFEADAPEKEILRWMAAVAAWAAQALDTAIEELPQYRKRIDAIVNHTMLDEQYGEQTVPPVLTRAYAYQQKTADVVLHPDRSVTWRVFSRQEEQIDELSAQNQPDAAQVNLFFGDSLERCSLSDALLLLFRQMIIGDAVVRVCGVCGRYFVPTVRSNEKYCDFVSPEPDGTALTCKQRSTRIRLETDVSLKLLKGAYDKNFIKSGRKSDPDYRERIFRPWYAWAKKQRQQYLDGKVTIEQLTERLQRNMEEYETEIS